MDWENERYVRLYTRDTVDMLMMPWEARVLFGWLLRYCDRAGVIELGKHDPASGIASLMRVPKETVETSLAEWLDDKCVEVREHDGGRYLVVPNFIEAQEANQSDRARAKASRERRRDRARLEAITVTPCNAERVHDVTANGSVTLRDDSSHDVTPRHETNENVTRGHTRSHAVTPCRAVPNRAVPCAEAAHARDPMVTGLEQAIVADQDLRAAITDPAGFAEKVAGRLMSSGKPLPWAIAALQRAADEAAAARMAGDIMPPAKVASLALRYASNPMAPRQREQPSHGDVSEADHKRRKRELAKQQAELAKRLGGNFDPV